MKSDVDLTNLNRSEIMIILEVLKIKSCNKKTWDFEGLKEISMKDLQKHTHLYINEYQISKVKKRVEE